MHYICGFVKFTQPLQKMQVPESIQYCIEQNRKFTPKEIYEKVRASNYIGQEKAVKAVSLMACRHIYRLEKIFFDQVSMDKLPPKDNYLLVGPTGCGKTYLTNLIFDKILKLPTTIVDLTSYSETGYVGQDVVSILTRLVHTTNGDYDMASIGIVCLDEFDKLATSKNSAVFSGAGTTKDVSGFGVQKELLKIIEGAEIDVPVDLTHSTYAPRATMSTHFIPFIALGAFSGLNKTIGRYNKKVGFKAEKTEGNIEDIAYQLTEEHLSKAAHFQQYGLMPELIGRFSRILPFHPLSEDHLKSILNENLIKKYKNELALLNASLEIDEKVLDHITKQALKMETGARGLRTSLTRHIEDAMFELYSNRGGSNRQQIALSMHDDEIKWALN